MKHPSRPLLSLLFAAAAVTARAQEGPDLLPVVFEAESGTIGAQFSVLDDPSTGIRYATINSTVGGGNPGSADRVITYTVTFPSSGTYELYARLRVGPNTFNDDSMYYGNGFGTRNVASDNDWVRVNGLANAFGYTLPTDRVLGAGTATSNVWKWVKLSAFPFDEAPISFAVDASNLTPTFQIAGREDGLWLDKFAFGRQGVFFTVANLDNGTPGTTEPPPPPFVPTGPPMALDQPKFVGGISSPAQDLNMTAYFNQVTPENGGKWGSVEGTRDVMSWGALDAAYNLAKGNVLKAPGDPRDGAPYPLPFRMHTLVWGGQQPAWIETLPPEVQRAEIEQWFAAVAARYPAIDFIDVVNEPIHQPPAGPGHGNYIAALGGTGATGWDWVITAFTLARQHFPGARLGINEYSVENDASTMSRYVAIIRLLQERRLIDYVGVQGHAFSTRVPAATIVANLDLLAATGLPVYVTELDIDGPTDEIQLADYQRIFPAFWEHPVVRGVTLWGYRPGHWRTAQGAYVVLDNGAERPAMVWLQDYVRHATLKPWITLDPVSPPAATVGDEVSLACEGDGSRPLSYRWRKDSVPIAGNPSASTPRLTLPHVVTADAGRYDCVVSNAAGEVTSRAASLTVDKAVGTVTLSNLFQTYDGGPHTVSFTTMPPGLTVSVTYGGSPSPPVDAGTYAVAASIVDADYVGLATATLTVARAAAVVSFVDLTLAYDGTPRAVAVTTVPPGLTVAVTYDGDPAPPVAPGSYAVVATVVDVNHAGSTTGTLQVSATAVVRHAPSLNGRVYGSVQVLRPESMLLSGAAAVSGDLLMPGSPAVRLNGQPSYGGTLDGDGDAFPSDHTIVLNGGASLRHVVRRTNAVVLPAVPAPPPPAGSRDVVLNGAAQDPGDFSTVRNLTLNGATGDVSVPPGTYGTFTVNGGGGLVLGVSGAADPAVYNVQALVLNGGAGLTVVGPVIVNVGGAASLDGRAGAPAHPEWLALNLASGGLTISGGATLDGSVLAPSSAVMVNGTIEGAVQADRLTINGGGTLRAAP